MLVTLRDSHNLFLFQEAMIERMSSAWFVALSPKALSFTDRPGILLDSTGPSNLHIGIDSLSPRKVKRLLKP